MPNLMKSSGGGVDLDNLTPEERGIVFRQVFTTSSAVAIHVAAGEYDIDDNTWTAPTRCIVFLSEGSFSTGGWGSSASTTGTTVMNTHKGGTSWVGGHAAIFVLEAGQTFSWSNHVADNGRYGQSVIAYYVPF